MKIKISSVILLAAGLSVHAAETVWLDSLDLAKMRQGYGNAQVNKSIREKPLAIAGKKFDRGVGSHATSTLYVDLAGETDRFLASVGVDDAAGGAASLSFTIYGDGRILWESGVMKTNQAAKPVDVDLKGVKNLLLAVGDGGDGISFDHADWAEARFIVSGKAPVAVDAPVEPPVILTPPPARTPKINGPRVHGCRPGNPFLFRIPATGERPMTFEARDLPASLKLDPQTGIITGTAPERGQYSVFLIASNKLGSSGRQLNIVSGDTLALTPPMGWNHWYAHYDRVTDKMMREAADIMVSSGMADVGYQYVSIDDCWMTIAKHADPLRVGPARDKDGKMLPNKHFPDMNAMTAYIHAKGLKAGIYTSPGPRTCAGFTGAFQHEAVDAQTFADWGFDFLKYDWCSYKAEEKGLPGLKKPYQLMGDLLKKQKRDMVFNLCQYGMGNVWEWGADVGGHCWRTAGDLGFELNRIFEVAINNAKYRAWCWPGSWNDPDYIQIGYIGNANGMGIPQPCHLTPSEQYAFMSLWCLMASPLFYSGDMSKLDPFTLNVLCNPEVIAVDQDPLGQCAETAHLDNQRFLMIKTMSEGSRAVGLANRGEMETSVTAKWAVLGVKGKQDVRDLWRQKDLGTFENEFTATVPRHGVTLIRLWPYGKRTE